jgi:hypothetical protein
MCNFVRGLSVPIPNFPLPSSRIRSIPFVLKITGLLFVVPKKFVFALIAELPVTVQLVYE